MGGFKTVSAAMVVMVALGVFGWLSIHHVDTSQFLYFFAIVAPSVGIVWNNTKTGAIKDTVDDVKDTVATIEHQTNGALTARIEAAVKSALESKDVVTGKDEGRPE